MKKVLTLAFASAMLLLSCSESSFKDLTDSLFNNLTSDLTNGMLQGSNLKMGFAPGGEIPEGSDFELDVQINSIIINGGSAIVDVTSPKQLSKLFLDIKDEDGVYQIDLDDVACSAEGDICKIVDGKYLYTLSIVFTQELSDEESLQITLSGRSKDNRQSETVEKEVTVKEIESGDLQISLSWNNADDLDLYVTTPSGGKIYYGNPIVGNGNLDLDAEYLCEKNTGIRNENIYFERPLTDNGDYQVSVKIYTKCNTKTGAAYSVSAFYEGKLFNFADKKQQGRFDDNDGNTSETRNTEHVIGTIKVQNGNVVVQ